MKCGIGLLCDGHGHGRFIDRGCRIMFLYKRDFRHCFMSYGHEVEGIL